MLTAILSSVATTIVLAAVAAFTRFGRQRLAKLMQRWRPDHRTLDSGPWPIHFPPESQSADVRLYIRCAPSHALRGASFDIAAAIQFAKRQLHFNGEPAYATVNDGVRLEAPIGSSQGYVWVCANGRVDLSISLPVSVTAQGRRRLHILDLLRPIADMAYAMGSTEYELVVGRQARRVRRRVDWRIGVSMYSRPDPAQSVESWQDLVFPVQAPPRAVADTVPFCPAAGYATEVLQNWKLGRPNAELLQAFLRSFLAENGYYDFESRVQEAASAL